MSRATRGVKRRREMVHNKWDFHSAKLALINPDLYEQVRRIAHGSIGGGTNYRTMREALELLGCADTAKNYRKLTNSMRRCTPMPETRIGFFDPSALSTFAGCPKSTWQSYDYSKHISQELWDKMRKALDASDLAFPDENKATFSEIEARAAAYYKDPRSRWNK